ncbi:uracil-DNA glycosylase family protein [Chordicoccus furentiruminis]|jgi:uracil-DNA glycosylase|uniref:uracil-DNA glycosylase family protein n=1 Tax=Chordicoccus furentiruminis TaxID=2709410 RepID=UPI0023A79CAD|nr:uracil-DNA glycosylase family protein [Chordicoccus furentiruminis]
MNLSEITEAIRNDPRNADYTKRGIPPILQISPEARVLIIGQAPGRRVEESGVPFDDKSGETLRDWMGVDRDTFYSGRIAVLPMDFYYPGKGKTGDLPPRPFIAREYHAALLQQMPDVRLTVLVGRYAIGFYLKGREERTLTETVRNFHSFLPSRFPIVHPSPLNFRWQARNPWFVSEVVPELRRRVAESLTD